MIHGFWAGISESIEVIERLADAHDSCITLRCKSSCIRQTILWTKKYFMIGRIKILWSEKSSLCPDWPERTWDDGSRSWHASAASNCPGVTNWVWWNKGDTASIVSIADWCKYFYGLIGRNSMSHTFDQKGGWAGHSWHVESEWILRQFTLPVASCRGELLPAPPSSCCLREKKKQWMESWVQSWGLPCARRNWNW